MSMRETLSSVDRTSELKSIAHNELKRPNAAVGQSGLMALYEAMFRYRPSLGNGSDQLFVMYIHLSIYPSVHKQLI